MRNSLRNFLPTEDKLKESVFFIEANSYEQLAIWREIHEKHDFEQDPCGSSLIIGYINNDDGMPVVVSVSFYYLYGYRICFYYATSRFVDNTMVNNFFESKYPVRYDNNSRRAMTDAMNFSHVFDMIDELKAKKLAENGDTS